MVETNVQYATFVARGHYKESHSQLQAYHFKMRRFAKKVAERPVKMSSNKKASTFLKECMADALLSLMKTGEFSGITINEIAETAGVNRSTWFRNFNSKSDALTFKLVQLWYRWTKAHGVNVSRYTVENAGDFFRFAYENRELLELMLRSGQQSAIYEAFYEIMLPQFDANAADCYNSRFYSYGLFGLLGEWSKREYHETPEELVELFYQMISY